MDCVILKSMKEKELDFHKVQIYISLFIVSFALISFEIIITRIFNAVTWYYFAFFAISIAMFGLTIGSLIVYFVEINHYRY